MTKVVYSKQDIEAAKRWKDKGYNKDQVSDMLKRRRETGASTSLKDFGVGAALSPAKTVVGQGLSKTSPFYWTQKAIKPLQTNPWVAKNTEWVRNAFGEEGDKSAPIYAEDIAQRDADKLSFETQRRGEDAHFYGDLAGFIGTAVGTSLLTGGLAGGIAGKAANISNIGSKASTAKTFLTTGLQEGAEYYALDRSHDVVDDVDQGLLGGLMAFVGGGVLGGLLSKFTRRVGRKVVSPWLPQEVQEGVQKIINDASITVEKKAGLLQDLVKDSNIKIDSQPAGDTVDRMRSMGLDEDYINIYEALTESRYKQMADSKSFQDLKNKKVRENISEDMSKKKSGDVSTLTKNIFQDKRAALKGLGEGGELGQEIIDNSMLDHIVLRGALNKKYEDLFNKVYKISDFAEKFQRGGVEAFTGEERTVARLYKNAMSDIHKFFGETTGESLGIVENYVHRILQPKWRRYILDNRNRNKVVDTIIEERRAGIMRDLVDKKITKEEVSSRIKSLDTVATRKEIAKSLEGYSDSAAGEGVLSLQQSFEKNRELLNELPEEWFAKDMKSILPTYLDEVSQRISFVRAMGPNAEVLYEAGRKMLRDYYDKGNMKWDLSRVQKIFEQLLNRTPSSEIVKTAKAIQVLKLSYSAPANIADLVITGIDRPIGTLVNAMKVVFSKSAKKIADNAGAAMDELSRARSMVDAKNKFVKTYLGLVGFNATQRWADRVVALNAIDKAKALSKALKKNPSNLPLLQKAQDIMRTKKGVDMLLNASTEQEWESVYRIAGASEFLKRRPISFLDAPYYMDQNEALPSLMFQFLRFSANLSTNLNREILQKFKTDKVGAIKSLGAFLAYASLAGWSVEKIQGQMKGWVYGISSLIASGEYKTKEQEEEVKSFMASVFYNIGEAGGFGLVYEVFADIMGGAKAGKDVFSSFKGPVFSDIATIFGTGATTVLDIYSGEDSIKTGKYWTDKALSLARVYPVLGLALEGAVDGNRQNSSLEFVKSLYEEREQDQINRKSILETTREMFGGILPSSGSPAIKSLVRTNEMIREEVKGINQAQAFSMMAGTAPGEVIIEGNASDEVRMYLERGYGKWFKVKEVIDGDTVLFEDGSKARLVGLDTPETMKLWKGQLGDFGGADARTFLRELLPSGKNVYLAQDKKSPSRDVYGRRLGYLFTEDGVDVNKSIVEGGYAKPLIGYPLERDLSKEKPATKKEMEKFFEVRNNDFKEKIVSMTNKFEGNPTSYAIDVATDGETFPSYGSFQMNRGVASGFAKEIGMKNSDPNTEAFKKEWMEKASAMPQAFRAAEVEYMLNNSMYPKMEALRKAGIPEKFLSDLPFNSLVFDIVTNHGKNSTVIERAFDGMGDLTMEQAVERITELRKRQVIGHKYEEALKRRYDEVANSVMNAPREVLYNAPGGKN